MYMRIQRTKSLRLIEDNLGKGRFTGKNLSEDELKKRDLNWGKTVMDKRTPVRNFESDKLKESEAGNK